ncbi:MAG TPA: chemotaxis protein CheW [Candidatus Dormibacteraeota bacterium]|nr:chemotaxis protein CheW [Candidatus Dormibacteraeota bacterium]
MNATLEVVAQSFVLLHLGGRRFALSADIVAELVQPGRVFTFPHTTENLEGVLVRRGHIVPICDFARRLLGARLTDNRYYLIARRRFSLGIEWIALPVTGQCELITAEMLPATGDYAPHVAGWLSHEGEIVEVLDLARLTPGPLEETLPASESTPIEIHP